MINYQQTQEGVARELYDQWLHKECGFGGFTWDELYENVKGQWCNKATQILSLLFTPEEIEEWKKGGYPAIVCKDQSLPEFPYMDELEYCEQTCNDFRWGADVAQHDMKDKSGFRRVKGVK